MKYAYISTITPGYMFAMNATINANKYYGTNAEVHLLYHPRMEKDYMKRCETAFPFEVRWIPMADFGTSFHNTKYRYAASLKGEYDSVCLIDADLFICCDTKEYFEKTANENVLISSDWPQSRFSKKEEFFAMKPEEITNRCWSLLADFPVFVNPKFGEKLFDCWYKNTHGSYVDNSKEPAHPLVAFNRCLRKALTPEQIVPLDGTVWVCDANYWDLEYIRHGDIMVNSLGQRVHAIHNKWWKVGRQSGEWLGHAWVKSDNVEVIKRLDRGEKNMNEIKDFMAWFNEMTPATQRDDYLKEKVDRKKYLKSVGKLL